MLPPSVAPTPVDFAYYFNIVLYGSHNNFLFGVAVSEHVVFYVISFI